MGVRLEVDLRGSEGRGGGWDQRRGIGSHSPQKSSIVRAEASLEKTREETLPPEIRQAIVTLSETREFFQEVATTKNNNNNAPPPAAGILKKKRRLRLKR